MEHLSSLFGTLGKIRLPKPDQLSRNKKLAAATIGLSALGFLLYSLLKTSDSSSTKPRRRVSTKRKPAKPIIAPQSAEQPAPQPQPTTEIKGDVLSLVVSNSGSVSVELNPENIPVVVIEQPSEISAPAPSTPSRSSQSTVSEISLLSPPPRDPASSEPATPNSASRPIAAVSFPPQANAEEAQSLLEALKSGDDNAAISIIDKTGANLSTVC